MRTVQCLLSLVVLALAASPLAAQITGPESASFAVGQKNAAVVVKLTPDIEDAQYEVLSDQVEAFREFESVMAAKTRLRVRVNTSVAGTGWVVVAATQGGKLLPLYRCRVTVGDAPGPGPTPPPPTPGPTPGPTPPPDPPKPDPSPTPTKFVVVIEESKEAAATRGELYSNASLIDYYAANGIKTRRIDKDVVDSQGKPPADVARFLDGAKGKPLPRVYLVDEHGKTLYGGNLHDEPADLLNLLKKYAGK